MSKKCTKCGEEFKGFGDVCSKCRKLGRSGTFQQCEVCGAFVESYGKICDSCGKGEPDTHISVVPMYTVPEEKMKEFRATWPAFYDAVQKGPKDSLYFGWCESGNQVINRQAFTSAKALMGQLEKVGVALEVCRTILGEEGRVDVSIVGPESELAQLKDHLAVLQPRYFELEQGSRWYNRGTAGPDTHVQVAPLYTVPEDKVAAFQELIGKFYTSSNSSTKERLYYGWAREGNNFFCRQGFRSAEGFLSHMQDIDAVLKEAMDLAGNSAACNILGPKEELDKLRSAASGDSALGKMSPVFYDLDVGSLWL